MQRGRFILVLLIACLFESGLSLCGFRLPLLAVCVLYAGMWRQGLRTLPETMLAAAMLDAIWCHRVPAELLTVLAVALLASQWRRLGASSSWTSLALAGLAVGAIGALAAMFCRMTCRGGWMLFAEYLLAGMILAPLVVPWLEKLLRPAVYWTPSHGGTVDEME